MISNAAKTQRTFVRKFIYSFVALLTVASFTLAPATAFATDSQELQSQLDAAMAKLDSLQSAIDEAEAKLEETAQQLDETESKIADLGVQIQENEAKLSESQDQLSSQMSSTYKQGNVDLISIIFSADNFEDLVTRITYANKVSNAQQEVINGVVEAHAALESSKADLETQKAEQEELVAAMSAEAEAANAAAAEQSNYVDQLSDELKAAVEAEQAAEEERKRQEAEAAAAAAAAAQAAAAKTADSNAANNNSSNNNSASNSNSSTDNSSNSNNSSTDNSNSNNSSNSNSNNNSGTPSNYSGSAREIAVQAALAQVGNNYSHANTTSSGFDCNGLCWYAWGVAGVSIPRASGHYTSNGQFQYIKRIGNWVTSVSDLQAGDLVFYSYDGGATTYHVAMYIGNGQVVQALSYSQGIKVTSVTMCTGFCGGGSPI